MIGLALGLALQIGAAPYAAMPGVDSVPSDAIADSLRSAESRFMSAWRREWMLSSRRRASYQRLASLHCHHDGSWESGAPNLIRSARSSRSFCPIWYALDDSLTNDEADGIDGSLMPESRRKMRAERERLIAGFQQAVAQNPANPWLVGQLVRLAVDQDWMPVAREAASRCAAAKPWCLLLDGYANYSAGRIAPADSAFQRATAAMEPTERCKWTSIALLLEQRARAAYERLGCTQRDSIDASFWWLADPLYIEPGNARRAEHYARKVLVVLHAGLTHDERWDWRPRNGGDALATMIVRYGWPSSLYWAGLLEDGGHFEWLGFRDNAVNVAPEYALPRFSMTPPWRVVLDPSTLTKDDWSAFAPRQGYGGIEWENDSWPVEHSRRTSGPVLDLAEQTVILRRDNDALLAIAFDLPQRFFRPGTSTQYDAAIIAARDPSERWVPSRTSIVIDGKGTTVLMSPLTPRAQIISAELAPADGATGLAARARRAVQPPPPLSVLPAGEIAISEPLFFRPDTDGDPPTTAPAAITRMLGSLTMSESRVGVYWETYGVAPGDTVDVSIRIGSRTRPGLLRRLGASLGVVETDGSGIAIGWREPRLGRREGLTWAGDVPIQARSIVFDVTRLKPGAYSVEVSVSRGGAAPVKSRREIVISR
jgi:hypothetical protein